MSYDFTFNKATGELTRGGKVMTFRPHQARIFAALTTGRTRTVSSLSQATGLPSDHIGAQIYWMRRYLQPFGIEIANRRGAGYWLVVRPMPVWRPNVPPPFALEDNNAVFERGQRGPSARRLSVRQQDEREQRYRGNDQRDLTGTIFGDPPRGFSALDESERQ